MPEDPIADAMRQAGGFVAPKDNDPVDPKPADPVDPVDPKPADPVDPKPADPVDPKPADPVDPVDPKADPVDPVDPASAVGKIIIPEPPVVQGDEFDKLLAERSKGRFKNLSDIDNALEAAPKNAFVNEQIAKANEYIQQGGTFQDFARTQTIDYVKMPDLDIIKEGYALSDPNLSADEVQLLAEEEYGVSENASEREKSLAQIRLKRDATKSRQALVEHQSKWAVPQASDEDIAAARTAEGEQWVADLSQAVDGIDKVDFVLNEKDTFPFEVSAEAKTAIKEQYADVRKFFLRYRKEDGSSDTQAFVKDMLILNNFEHILRSAASFNKGQGIEQVVDQIKNPDFKGENVQKPTDGKLTIQEQAARKFYGLT